MSDAIRPREHTQQELAEGVSKTEPRSRERTHEGTVHRWLARGGVKANGVPRPARRPVPLVVFA